MQNSEPNSLTPGMCISFRLRRAARASARHFDNALKPVGLRNTQFTLLSFLSDENPLSIGELARDMGVDATTLNRNLEVLIRRGLVENQPSSDGRERLVSLTARGQQKYDEAMPVWRGAQQSLLTGLPSRQWPIIADDLSLIEDKADPI